MKKGSFDYKVESNNYRINLLRTSIYNKYNKRLSNYEMSSFLKEAMNFTEFQTWLLDQKVKKKNITVEDLYEKLFLLKTNDELVELYGKKIEDNKSNIQGYSRIRRR